MKPEPADRTVLADGVRTRVRETGHGDGLLLIHGFADSLGAWWRNAPIFARRYHTIAYDLHGCGASEKGPGRYDISSLGRQALGVLDALGVERAGVVGHSLGARIALAAALAAPRRIRALVLEAPAAFAMGLPWEMQLLTLPGVGELLATCATPWSVRLATKRAVLRVVHPESRTWSEERYRRLPVYEENPRALVRGWMRLARGVALDRPHALEDRYAGIDIPALVIVGERDPNVPPALGERLARTLPRARLLRYQRAGHVLHAECDRDFTADAMRFFDEQERTLEREVPGG